MENDTIEPVKYGLFGPIGLIEVSTDRSSLLSMKKELVKESKEWWLSTTGSVKLAEIAAKKYKITRL